MQQDTRPRITNPAGAALRLRPFTGGFGAEVLGVQVAAVDDDTFPAVYAAFLEHQLLLFRDQILLPADQVAFARRFGEVQVHVMDQYHAGEHPELYTLSNLGADGRPSGRHPDRGTLAWHTDGSWRRATGQATMLYAEQMPQSGGDTSFADMYSAYAALDPEGHQWEFNTRLAPVEPEAPVEPVEPVEREEQE